MRQFSDCLIIRLSKFCLVFCIHYLSWNLSFCVCFGWSKILFSKRIEWDVTIWYNQTTGQCQNAEFYISMSQLSWRSTSGRKTILVVKTDIWQRAQFVWIFKQRRSLQEISSFFCLYCRMHYCNSNHHFGTCIHVQDFTRSNAIWRFLNQPV